MRINKGFSLAIVMLAILVVLLLVGTILFSTLTNPDLENQISSRIYQNISSPIATPPDVSDSLGLDTIEAEFEATQLYEFETDISELEESANLLE